MPPIFRSNNKQVCALMDLDCTIYMGAADCERQALNVFRMKMLGAKVRAD